MEPVISDADVRKIEKAINQNKNDKNFLPDLLKKKRVVPDKDVPEKTVRLNSLVLLWHSILKKVVKFRIVLPTDADLKQRNLSVFSPISMAIFGSRENESVRITIGGIEKELKIIRVFGEQKHR